MDMPPSGWYPDPYGVAGLLRWWDGSAWTEHTHQDGGSDGAGGAEPAMAQSASTAQPASTAQLASTAQPTTVQPTTVQPTTVQPTTVEPAWAQPALPAGGEHFDPGVNGTQ